MTAHNQSDDQPQTRIFVKMKDIQRRPRPEQTEEEIEAWMVKEIQADKKILDLLATL